MAKTNTQTLISWLRTRYKRILQPEATHKETTFVKERVDLHYPARQKKKATAAQIEVRQVFKACTVCFAGQPDSGGATPPDIGPRNRSWWFDTAAAIKPFYPHSRRILGWDGLAQSGQERPGSDFVYRLTHNYIKVDEQDFLDFYEDMKPLYGYPWSATNDPDEIAYKMWQIIAGEIEYSGETFVYMALTPGETSKQTVGDCEDMSILFFALLWKALLEVGKNLAWVNSHISLVYVDLGEVHHVYCWWQDKNDATRIIECTSKAADLPADIYGAPLYDTADPTWLFTRVNQTGEYDPWTIVLAEDSGHFYYNYFMQQTLNSFFNNVTPDWCKPRIKEDIYTREDMPNINWQYDDYLVFGGKSGLRYFTFIKFDFALIPEDALRYINLYCIQVFSYYYVQYKTFYVDVYKVTGPWEETTLTWNTHPPLGSIISSWSRMFDFGASPAFKIYPNQFFKFTIPNAGSLQYGICIVPRVETEHYGISVRSKEYSDPTKWPYISLS